ncbi:hypothetical protein MUP29_11410 [bacterium]|nr:hypothetical protein [bacterium]
MRMISLFSLVIVAVAVVVLTAPGAVYAQGDETISTAVIDAETFVTVKESVTGEVLSLYRIKGDRIVLVDTVVNTNNRSSSDTSFPKRYLIRLDVENR